MILRGCRFETIQRDQWNLLSPKTVEVGIVYSPSPATVSINGLSGFHQKFLNGNNFCLFAMCSLVLYGRQDFTGWHLWRMKGAQPSENLLSLLISATTPIASVASPSAIRVHMMHVRSPASLSLICHLNKTQAILCCW